MLTTTLMVHNEQTKHDKEQHRPFVVQQRCGLPLQQDHAFFTENLSIGMCQGGQEQAYLGHCPRKLLHDSLPLLSS